MSTEVIIRTVFEAAAVLLFIIALLNEKRLIAFEHRIAVRWRTYRMARSAAVRAEDVYCAQETVRNSERSAAGVPQRRPRRTSRSHKPAA